MAQDPDASGDSFRIVAEDVHRLESKARAPLEAAVKAAFGDLESVEGAAFLTAAARADDDGALRGVVVRVEGSAPARGAPFVSARTGRGVAWFPLEEASSLNADHVNAALRNDALGLRERGASAYVYRHHKNFVAEALLVVHAQDSGATRALLDAVKARAASPMSVHELVTSKEYVAAIEGGRRVRAELGAALADHLGVRVRTDASDNEVKAGDTPTHFAVPVARVGDGALTVYDVFDDALDPRRATTGLLVFGGTLPGVSLFRGRVNASATGDETRAWAPRSSDRPPVISAQAPLLVEGGASRRAAISHRTSAVAAANARARLHSMSAIEGYNPRLERETVSLDDKYVAAEHERAAMTVDDGVERLDFELVAGSVPGVDSTDMTLRQLDRVLAKTTSRALPVRVGGEAWHALARAWPRVRATQTQYARFADVVANEHDNVVDVDVGMLGAVARMSIAGTL